MSNTKILSKITVSTIVHFNSFVTSRGLLWGYTVLNKNSRSFAFFFFNFVKRLQVFSPEGRPHIAFPILIGCATWHYWPIIRITLMTGSLRLQRKEKLLAVRSQTQTFFS